MSGSFGFQEIAVAAIVLSAALWITWTTFMKYLGPSVSLWLIKNNHTRIGFGLKKRLPSSGCANCACPTPPQPPKK